MALCESIAIHIQCVDDAGNVTKDGQEDVDEQIGATATLKEYTKRREDNGKNDLDDVGAGECHFCCLVV